MLNIIYSTLLILALPCQVFAWSFEGFTEPDLSIAVAAPTAGILVDVKVKVGDQVKKGQVLALLDNRILISQLKIAKARSQAKGAMKVALAKKHLQQQHLNRLLPLLSKGLVQQTEIDESRANLNVAKAEVQIVKEQSHIGKLEVQQIQTQINRHILKSPITGIVTEVHKEVSEWVGGNEPVVITVARVNPLRLSLHIPTTIALNLHIKQTLSVKFSALPKLDARKVKIDFISPITDAGSDTVEVGLILNNKSKKLRSGLKCHVSLPGSE